jgi:transcription antitermination factor NusG
MNNFASGWYLIYTKPHHERKVHSYLSAKDIPSYLPTRNVLRVWHDRKKYVNEPLFPSYVFVYLNNKQHYFESMDADGVLYYVRCGKEVVRVDARIIENIKLATSHAQELEVSKDDFKPGQKLVIAQGALTGLNCEVVQIDSVKKLLVRVDLLQRNLLLSIAPDQLIAV